MVENGAHKLLHMQGDVLPLPVWLAMLAGVIPAAMIAHHLVERPARAAMRRRGVPFESAFRHGGGGFIPALQG
jgi:peptidoglycan/LPS O-acetylase OafA/YrhL